MKGFYIKLFFLLISVASFAQPVKIKDLSQACSGFTTVGSMVYYTCGSEVWKTNGTTTTLVGSGFKNPRRFVEVNGLVYFFTDSEPSEPSGERLYVINGTTPQFKYLFERVVDIEVFKSKLYIICQDGKLFSVDSASRILITDVNGNSAEEHYHNDLATFKDYLYFSASDPVNGFELWRTNGTSSGTVFFKSFSAGNKSSGIGGFEVVGNNMFFFVNANLEEGDYDSPILNFYKTDGTTNGTTQLASYEDEYGNGMGGGNLTLVGNNLFFTTYQSYRGVDLYKVNLSNFVVNNVTSFPNSFDWISRLMEYKGNLFFTYSNDGFGWELWRSDGTDKGTYKFKDIYTDRYGFDVEKAGEFMFFSAGKGASEDETYDEQGYHVFELWQSDLTSEGTVKVSTMYSLQKIDLSTNPYDSDHNQLSSIGTTVLFTRDNYRTKEKSLWKYTADSFSATYFTTINTVTDKDIKALQEGDTLFTDKPITFRVNTIGQLTGVKLYVNDVLRRTETTKPFALAGDFNGDYTEWTKLKGNYKLTAVPYAANGTQGKPLSYNFIVLDPKDTIVNNNPNPIRLVLINATSDTQVRDLNNTDTVSIGGSLSEISIQAITSTSVGSVVFYVDGSIARTETTLPYAIKGDNSGNYTPWPISAGTHSVMVKSYSGSGGSGTLIAIRTISLLIKNSTGGEPQPTGQVSFTLVNANSDLDISSIVNNQVINLAVTGNKLNIRANSVMSGTKSIVFDFNGTAKYKVESTAPYSLFGDANGNYAIYVFKTGTYTLKATPYTGTGGSGTAGVATFITFHVTGTAAKISTYPNPAEDIISLQLEDDENFDGVAEVTIIDEYGKVYLNRIVNTSELKSGLGFGLQNLDMKQGIYFMRIQREGEDTQVLKVIKK